MVSSRPAFFNAHCKVVSYTGRLSVLSKYSAINNSIFLVMADIIDLIMARILEMNTAEMDTCEPDSTVEIIEEVTEEQNPLQAINRVLVERQHMCATMVADSIRERDRVRSQLEETRRRRELITADYLQIFQSGRSAACARSLANLKASLADAITKCITLRKEIEIEKIWRPPSVDMCLQKQQELRERVEHMRKILETGRIRTPDE